jgi:hypothetical protein
LFPFNWAATTRYDSQKLAILYGLGDPTSVWVPDATMDPNTFAFAQRHNNVEALYRKLKEQERRDKADTTELLKELHRM